MFSQLAFAVAGLALVGWAVQAGRRRLRLSRAKHRSLAGHARISRRLAAQVPFYEHAEPQAFACDGAPEDIAERRRAAFRHLREELERRAPKTRESGAELSAAVSDLQFTDANRVPFQFRGLAAQLPVGALADATDGVRIRDLDGNWSWDVGGSYGVNLLGQAFYKRSIKRAERHVRKLGPVLGPYHPLIIDNVRRLREISGLDEVSFHMSGTEAVMQAVRLARYHTGRRKLVQFTGAYHGWWDDVQPGVGNPLGARHCFLLAEQSERTLTVLRTRRDIACVLVNPLQALNINRGPSSDATLLAGRSTEGFDRERYARWLRRLREVCDQRDVVLIFDEVFVGFRLGLGGAQEFFGVRADLVTYGKTLGGGLPVGVLCGRAPLMKRFRQDRPTDLCFARGTFNSHPYVMATMHEFLNHAIGAEFREQAGAAPALWDARFQRLNARLAAEELPVRLRNMVSVAAVDYLGASRFHWLFQFYLRAEGLALSWVGTGRFIFSHDYTEADFEAVSECLLRAARRMQADGWWWNAEKLEPRDLQRQVLREMLRRRLAGA
jgi:glutamate-1-semialdehyde 2,1-aminomutase